MRLSRRLAQPIHQRLFNPLPISSGGGGAGNPVVLPVSAGAPKAVWGFKASGSAYSGPCLTVYTTAAPSTPIDIGFDIDGKADRSALLALTQSSASPITIGTVYDTSGNGVHLTAPSAGVRPIFFDGNTFKGQIAIDFAEVIGTFITVRYLNLPTVSIASQDVAYFEVLNPMTSADGYTFMQLAGTASAVRVQLFNNSGISGIAALQIRSQPQVIGVSSTAAGRRYWARDTNSNGSAATVDTITSGRIGAPVTSPTENGGQSRHGMVLYAGLDTTQGNAVRDALNTGFKIDTVFTSRVIFDGDSIMQGSTARFMRNRVRQCVFDGTPEIFNYGIGGQKFATIVAGTLLIAKVLSASNAIPQVVLCNAGTNDFTGVETANGIKGYEQSYCTKVRTINANAKIIFTTITPRYSNPADPWETVRTTINDRRAILDSGQDGASNFKDNALVGIFGANNDFNYFSNTDQLHPNQNGYAVIATYDSAAVNAFIP